MPTRLRRETEPLRITELASGSGPLGLAVCPGKRGNENLCPFRVQSLSLRHRGCE